jgi:hypothetical protein
MLAPHLLPLAAKAASFGLAALLVLVASLPILTVGAGIIA